MVIRTSSIGISCTETVRCC